MSSKEKKYPADSWAAVRKNVEYLGCYPDFAYLHPEYQDGQYYHVNPPVYKVGEKPPTRREIKQLPDDIDPRLPKRSHFENWLDGPARIIPSIDRITRAEDNPMNMRLDKALRRCYNLARSRNKKYFALQNGGLCMATNDQNFKSWGTLNPSKCESCKQRCKESEKPCGKKCIDKSHQCNEIQHETCAHNQSNKGTKGGGYFTNSVFEVKDTSWNPEPTDETLPEDRFALYRYAAPKPEESMDCPNFPDNFFPLSPTQMFIQQYFTIENPIKGLLSFKSAGSGKTCEALNVIGNFMGKWRIVWVTRDSLRAVPLDNLYQDICQLKLREIIDSPDPITLATGEVLAKTPSEKIAFIRSDRGPAVLKRYGIEIEKQRIISYDEFVKMIAGKGTTGRKLRQQQLADSPNGDMGYRTLFVFDEAHNLITTGLNADERKAMDAIVPSVNIGGHRLTKLKDIYGSLPGINGNDPIRGRDLIPAMFWHSYRESKADSAKLLLLTATPMSTSPIEMFWLINLCLSDPRQRLSLNINDYYDPYSMKLKDEAVIKFAAAAHGRISYFNTSKDPTKFAKKLFYDRMDSVLHQFHQDIIQKEVEKELKKKNRDTSKIVALYRNLSLCARVKGSFFDKKAIRQYEEDLKRLEDWSPEKEEKKQTEIYYQEVEEARRVFKLNIRKADEREYMKKVKQYHKLLKNHKHPSPIPKSLQNALDINGDLLPIEEFLTDEQGKLLSLEQWFARAKAPHRQRAAKRRYNTKEARYAKFLIQDPSTGKMRIRSLIEFLDIKRPSPTLEGKESRKGVSFLMWYRNYQPDVFRELMPYYAPKIHDMIENIVEIEKNAHETYGHGFKHTIFTFSQAGKGSDSAYGSRLVASALHARSDLFKILLVYKYETDKKGNKRLVLKHDIPGGKGKWGVAVLSSKDMPNIYHKRYGGNKSVEYNARVIAATQAAFNDAKNRYGDQIKILLMDGAYTEGVGAYDDNIAHFLNQGLSRSQLEQASARSARYCRSKNIPFFQNVGGFLEMYFYSLRGLDAPSDLYEQMMDHIPYEEQLNLNMMDVFNDMAAHFSIDYWLNYHVNEYDPEYQGKIVDYYPKWDRAYVIAMDLKLSSTAKRLPYEFIVDPESVVQHRELKVGDIVTNTDGAEAAIQEIDREQNQVLLDFGQSVQSTVSLESVRLAPGQKVDFRIPYGVDMAQRVMNIANFNSMRPNSITLDMIHDIQIPEQALTAISTSFRGNSNYIMLGILTLLRLIYKTGGVGIPVHMVLDDIDRYTEIPPHLHNFTMTWQQINDQQRRLHAPHDVIQKFLSPTQGISFLLLLLYEENQFHSNLLIYTPQWQTIERFDPMGYEAHSFDAVELDTRLSDFFQQKDPSIRYMSAAETTPLIGLHRLQVQERQRHHLDPSEFSTAFILFYMHMRILSTAQALRDYPDEKRLIFPLHFQRGLIHTMQSKFRGKMTAYIRNYAELTMESRKMVEEWDGYQDQYPFWANTILLIREMLKLIQGKSPLKHKPSPTKGIYNRIANMVNQLHL